jgi:N-acetylmuramoyl-L-alanine amidase
LENGLGYHFVIGNGSGTPDGEIEIGNRRLDQINGAHAGVEEYNHYGIRIVRDFNQSRPTVAQMASLSVLVEYLQNRCHIISENVIMHKHCRQTDCPGRYFLYYKLLANTCLFELRDDCLAVTKKSIQKSFASYHFMIWVRNEAF